MGEEGSTGQPARLSLFPPLPMRRMCQADYQCSADVRAEQAVPETEARRRVLTVTGATSSVLAAPLVRDESTHDVVSAIAGALSNAARRQVVSVCSDAPSAALWSGLRGIFPNLRVLALDPTHLAMRYEYASGGIDSGSAETEAGRIPGVPMRTRELVQ